MAAVHLEKIARKESDSSILVQSGKDKTVGPTPKAILKNYRPLFVRNNNIIINAQKGLPISAVYDFSIVSLKSQKEIAGLIHTSAKTLQNYASGLKQLPTLQSELLLKLFALYEKGLEVFGEVESFNRWLRKPAFGLYNSIPDTLLTTMTGINEVMDELIRIEYGDLA
jgi:putative toxin-antitoxin system antitoxin component (TIGR02293 family)